ncbi:MAG: acyltransferase [Acidobacteria bacterium]|nr:acyltransferase [Acidobacteriota bacterium]
MSESDKKLKLEAQAAIHDPSRSPLRRYALLTTGGASLWKLFVYELVTGLFLGWPGALGIWLRRKCYRRLFAAAGRDLIIGRNVTIRGFARIRAGRRVVLDDNAVLDARGAGASITLGDEVLVGRNSIVRCRGESLTIGDGTDIGCNCIVATDSRLAIGKDVLVAAYTYIAAGGNHNYADRTVPIRKQGFTSRGGVTIGDDVWIGSHTAILDGVTVGRGAVIGAHSLVNKDLPEWAIAYGCPARVERSR